jgi:LacI family transcriptional regulator
MPAFQRILVSIPDRFSFGRGLLTGVFQRVRQIPHWQLVQGYDHYQDQGRIGEIPFDGAIAFIDTINLHESLRGAGKPFVNVSATMAEIPRPAVLSDDRQAGLLGAEHFLDRGFRNLAFLGVARRGYSMARQEGFCRRAEQEGLAVYCHNRPVSHYRGPVPWQQQEPELLGWLDSLPRPIGMMVAVDSLAPLVNEYCRDAGTRIPDELALLGVNNDLVQCESTQPPLSSIEADSVRVGYRAGQLLEDLLGGAPAPSEPIYIPVQGVVCRLSTDALAIEDRETVEALAFIRNNRHRPITVADVLDHVAISRSSLERRFRQYLGRTPLAEIHRARIEAVGKQLIETDSTLGQIARRCGFSDGRNLATLFGKITGMTPTQYRRQFRLGG